MLAVAIAQPAAGAPGDLTAIPAPMIGSAAPPARPLNAGDASVASETGAFTYAYPIAVPPGRLGMQPALSLEYSSQAPIYGGIAAGWSLDIPEIIRDTSRSLLEQDYFDGLSPEPWRREHFVSTMAGGRPLVVVTEPTGLAGDALAAYRAQNDASFDRYERMEPGEPYAWRVLGTGGVTNYFGDRALAPAATENWSPLTRSVDAFGNTVEYRWEGTRIQQIGYTSNATAGLAHFATVDFVWETTQACGFYSRVNELDDNRLGITRGGQRLMMIRATAHDPGAPAAVKHTREVRLTYDADAADCHASHGPLNLLTSIQESAWGDGAPRANLAPVTFGYNRLERTYDQQATITAPQLGFEFETTYIDERDNLGWGIRRTGAQWPSVNAMMLDFDGDGLVDRLRTVEHATECKFVWQKNLGRGPGGHVRFAPSGDPITMPRLPWADGAGRGEGESCSLSAQFTMYQTEPDSRDPDAVCGYNTGSYLAYRWLDLDSDGLPDLVGAVHHDPNYLDPAAIPNVPWTWPACDGDGAGAGVAPDGACVGGSVRTCGDGRREWLCGFDDASLSSCMADATPATGNQLERISGGSFDPRCFEDCTKECNGGRPGSHECNAGCETNCTVNDEIGPPNDVPPIPADACHEKVAFETCGRYPWIIHWNRGGTLDPAARVINQPLQLESDSGDSAFGGRGLSTTQRGIDDLDGDGHLDAFVLGRVAPGTGGLSLWWEVFRGDGKGAFLPVGGTDVPFFWQAPRSAPVGLSCTGTPGGQCSPLTFGPPQYDHFDLRGLAMVTDLTGDGAADLIWKHSPTQFSTTFRWEGVNDGDPIELFPGDGMGFQVEGTPQSPVGQRLDHQSPYVKYLSRASVDAEEWLGVTPFITKATRQSRARLFDHDGDGRLDLLSSEYLGNLVWSTPELLMNVGGSFSRTYVPGIIPHLGQETIAWSAGYHNGPYRWATSRDLVDLDGDGLLESWSFENGQATYVRDADRQPLRLLRQIDNGRGNTTEVTYAPTTDAATVTQDAALRKATPHSMWVVASVTRRDAWDAADTATTRYQYKHPIWNKDPEGRWGFRGFEEVTTTAPSGERTVAAYGYDVDWSGRQRSLRTFAAETPSAPSTIQEMDWTSRSLFNGAITTYHQQGESSWKCGQGESEAACRAAERGRLTRATTWTNVGGQLWTAEEVRTIDGPVYGAGGRRTVDRVTLTSDALTYRVRALDHRAYVANDATPANDTLADLRTYQYDATGRYLLGESQYFAADLVEHADTTYRYDPAGSGVRIAERRPRQQPGGAEQTFVYDPTRRFVVTQTNEAAQVVATTYDPGTGALLSTEGPNRVSCGAGCTNVEKRWTEVDGLGRPVATYVNRAVPTQGLWVKSTVSLIDYVDEVVGGQPTKVTTNTRIEYVPPRWTREVMSLDGLGRPMRSAVATDNGPDAITTHDYDANGNLAAVTRPDPSAPAGSTAAVTYTYAHDSLGRQTSMRRPAISGAPSGVDLTYDGLVTHTQEIAGGEGGPAASKVQVHDAYGRLREVREQTGSDSTGPTYATTTYGYDARDAIARIASPDGVVTTMTHDFAGRRTAIERAGRTWRYGYDLHGNLVSEQMPPPNPALEAEYTTTFAYDALDRVSSRAVAGRELPAADKTLLGIGTITFAYDTCTNGIGRLCTVTLPGNHLTTSYSYDPEGNTSGESRAFDFGGVTGTRATSTTYGPFGRVAEHAYADNAVGTTAQTRARFQYDARGLPSGLSWITPKTSPSTDAPRPIATQVRNTAGQVLSRTAQLAATPSTWGWRDLASTWTYDRLGRMTSVAVADAAGGAPFARQALAYRGLDDPRSMQHVMGTATYDFVYDHDVRHQLTAVSEAAGKYSAGYTFTPGGKLATARVNAPAQMGGAVVNRDVNYAYASGVDPDAPSALVPVAGGANLRSYSYDSVGNLRDRRLGDPAVNPTDAFQYDGDDQLRRARKYTGTSLTGIEEYYYDHTGQRAAVVTRTGAGLLSKVRVFMGDTELELDPSSGAVQKAYAHLSLGTPVARVVSPAGGWTESSSTVNASSIELTYHGLASSTIAALNAGGALQAAFVYGPYGDVIQTSGNGSVLASLRRRFNDEFRDDQTGLLYYGARYYDGVMLGWTQADPLYRIAPDAAWTEPRRANLYAFTLHNPLRWRDPDGRDAVHQDPGDSWDPPIGDTYKDPIKRMRDRWVLNQKADDKDDRDGGDKDGDEDADKPEPTDEEKRQKRDQAYRRGLASKPTVKEEPKERDYSQDILTAVAVGTATAACKTSVLCGIAVAGGVVGIDWAFDRAEKRRAKRQDDADNTRYTAMRARQAFREMDKRVDAARASGDATATTRPGDAPFVRTLLDVDR